MIKIALIDDHELFRKSLSTLLSFSTNFNVVYDTNDGLAFLEYIKENDVDIILLDIQMPIINGFELCKILKSIQPEIKILIVSQLNSKEVIHHVMTCGANGFFSKNSSPNLLENAIEKIIENDYYFDDELGIVIKDAILWERREGYTLDFSESIYLSDREIEIINMACVEMSSKEIANKLCISTRTVENHRKRIMEKTRAKNFIGVILFALKINAITLDNFS
ncbi:response regulator transcription factor [Flavobacterium sp. J27]|uniref:response regulator transcription factor n=1 Tax=Flavobacterium sp. J27 TaxID=2060419 RepID=UPI0010314FC8|nr:response regulator transcription factor [Flavobacterium sp. J27]